MKLIIRKVNIFFLIQLYPYKENKVFKYTDFKRRLKLSRVNM